MGVPSLRMGHCQPTQKVGDLVIQAVPRPYHHVPVIGHDAVPEGPQRHTQERLVQDALECGVVLFLQEELGARWSNSARDRHNHLGSNGRVGA